MPNGAPAYTLHDCESHDHVSRGRVVIACDHASNAVPEELDSLGLGAEALTRHIAWDIGAATVARVLAERLRCVAVLANWSRLVIDCNRALSDPTSIVKISDGVVIPGNFPLSDAARRERAARYWAPYHERLDAELCSRVCGSRVPVLIAIHSFTPVFAGQPRPWHIGVLWDRDSRIARPLLAALRADPRWVVGDNEPYSGRHPADYTIDAHAEARGWPHVCVEIRQDLIESEAGARDWAERLHACLAPILADPSLYVCLEPSDTATLPTP